jgi:hypothetical protein
MPVLRGLCNCTGQRSASGGGGDSVTQAAMLARDRALVCSRDGTSRAPSCGMPLGAGSAARPRLSVFGSPGPIMMIRAAGLAVGYPMIPRA